MLPAAFPNLLVNGASGIAVGMATNCPPYNLVEVVQALRHLIKHPKAGLDDLMRFIPVRIFPAAARSSASTACGTRYATGRGSFGSGRRRGWSRCTPGARAS